MWMSAGLVTLFGALGCGDSKTVIERCDDGSVSSAALGLVHGRVTDRGGKGVKDVSVVTDGSKVQTREDGTFELAVAAGEDKVVSVEDESLSKAATTVRVDSAGVANVELEVSSLEKIEIEDAKAGGRFEGKDGFAVELPEKSLQTKDGKIAEGKAEIRYATIKEPAQMRGAPGEMRTKDGDGKERRISTKAIGEIRFYQKGEPLEFKGDSAKLELPLAKGSKEKDGAELDRFHYNEEKGEWEKEGKAKVDKGHVVADVKHFTWWAAGSIVADSTCVTVNLLDADSNPAAYTRVYAVAVDALLVASADTDEQGGVCLPLAPKTNFDLTAFFGAGSRSGEWRATVTTPSGAAACGSKSCEDLGEVRLVSLAGPQTRPDGGVEPPPSDGGVQPSAPLLDGIMKTLEDTKTAGVASLKFDGLVGQRISYSVKRVSGTDGNIELIAPNGDNVATLYTTSTDLLFSDVITLEETGVYTLEIGGRNDAMGTYAVEIWGVPDDVVAPIVIDGPKVTVKTTIRNQNAVLTFKANGGERLAYRASSTITEYTYATLTAPLSEEQVVGAPTSVSSAGNDATPDAFVLPDESGTYRLYLDPSRLGIGSLTIELWSVPEDATKAITIDGPAVSVQTTIRNQNALLTFGAKGTERLAYTVTSNLNVYSYLTLTAPLTETDVPDANTSVISGTEALVDAFTLPEEIGTYLLNLNPNGLGVGTLSVRLWSVPDDATGALTVGGAAQTINITTMTQNGAYTFTPAVGAGPIKITLTNNTNNYAYLTLISPTGATEAINFSSVASMSSLTSPAFTPAEPGTYTLKVDPSGKAIGTFSASVGP